MENFLVFGKMLGTANLKYLILNKCITRLIYIDYLREKKSEDEWIINKCD